MTKPNVLHLPKVLSVLLFVTAGCAHKQPVTIKPQVQAMSLKVDLSSCPDSIDATQERPLGKVEDSHDSGSCKPRKSHGYPIPDPDCTPGAINPTITATIIKEGSYRTGCVRDQATSRTSKEETYHWYGIDKPANNTGKSQTCELDHVVPLLLGGADTLDNIWPQCGPSHVILQKRYFKIKDGVELYLGQQVKDGAMTLKEAQKGIAEDWTQYIAAAKNFCRGAQCDDDATDEHADW
jgi:hypothetical protein